MTDAWPFDQERNVAAIVRGPRIDHEEVQPWSRDEAATFLAAARAHRLSALFAVGVAVGLRRGELLALAWDDVDLDRGILRVRRTVQRLRGQGLVFGPPKSSRSELTSSLTTPPLPLLPPSFDAPVPSRWT